MGLFDDYVDLQQFDSGGGLLGRLLALKHSQNQDQPAQPQSFAPQRPAPWLSGASYNQSPSNRQVSDADPFPGSAIGATVFVPYSPAPANQSDIQKVGIQSNESIYCRTMRNLCHSECVDLALQRDGIGPYRACVRECMQRAGCFDF